MIKYTIVQVSDTQWGVEATEDGVSAIVYTDTVFEYVECMCEEFNIFAQAREYERFNNQQCEFDDNAMEFDYV